MKIREISNKYISGKPPIHIKSIAEELGISKDIVAEHIDTLETLKLIEFLDNNNEVVVLTDLGKNIPDQYIRLGN